MDYYTYAYLREDGTPYYIGKGKGRRAFLKHGSFYPPSKERILFLKRNLTEEQAFNHEIYMIAVFGRKDLGTGILHNKTNGGDGCSGKIMTEKDIENRRKARLGKPLSESHKRKIAEANRGTPKTMTEKRRQILVINESEIQNRVIHTARIYTPSELQQASNYLNEMYAGKDLASIRTELLQELRKMKESVNQVMQTAIEMAQQAFVETETQSDYVLAGQTNLMDVAELCDVERLKKLFNSFNQKRDILHLLEQSINARGVQIFIGEEAGYDVLDNCSVVTSPYEVEGQILGVLGVIGPVRMHYERVIPIVDITAKMLSSVLNSHN